jgi:mono/diheme cytochrome c family protein
MVHSLVRVLLVSLFAVSLTTFSASSSRSQSAGETLFRSKCAACHGPDGKGETPTGKNLKVKDFASEDVQKTSEADLSAVISGGKGKMPAYKTLTPDEVKDLVAYVRAFGKKKYVGSS